jgi:hypothetical protein
VLFEKGIDVGQSPPGTDALVTDVRIAFEEPEQQFGFQSIGGGKIAMSPLGGMNVIALSVPAKESFPETPAWGNHSQGPVGGGFALI